MIDKTILILGGTFESYTLAECLTSGKCTGKLRILTSLSGATPAPRLPAGDVRFGGFGGVDGLTNFIRRENVTLLVDATHPFAERISHNAVLASSAAEITLLRLERPPWTEVPDDSWISVPSLSAATAWLREHPHRVFLTTGMRGLEAFHDCPGSLFVVRTLSPPELAELCPHPDLLPEGDRAKPWPEATFVQGRGPFSVEDELRLFKKHEISLLVSKNSGGKSTYAKINAARKLQLPVLMIERNEIHHDEKVSNVKDAIGWISNFV